MALYVAYIRYDHNYGAEAEKAKLNFKNAEQVEPGMTVLEVLDIMGDPERSWISDLDGFSEYYCYSTNNNSDPCITIEFDYSRKVVDIRWPREKTYPDEEIERKN